MSRIRRFAFLLALCAPGNLCAHLGSRDVFLDSFAGSYHMTVSVKVPSAIPGVVKVEVECDDKAVNALSVVPIPVNGIGRTFFAEPEKMVRSEIRTNIFTASVTVLSPGSWKLRIAAEGDRGRGELFVPAPLVLRQAATLGTGHLALFAVIGLLLTVGAVALAGASVREARLMPGMTPTRTDKLQARLVMLGTMVLFSAGLYGFMSWWKAEAAGFEQAVYKPPSFLLDVNTEGKLFASVANDGWSKTSSDLVPEQNHFIHMVLVSVPGMEKMWRVHPDMQVSGVFNMRLPAMDAGKYWAFGDILHANGFPETVSGPMVLKDPLTGGKPSGDDSQCFAPPVGKNSDPGISALRDKYRVLLVHTDKLLKAGETNRLQFRVEDKAGKPAEDLEPYMGMPAQAAVIKHDRSVFALLTPSGTVPAAALRLVDALFVRPPLDHSLHSMNMGVPAEFSMPYAFPAAGDYRIFLQVKRGGVVDTATFDVSVSE